MDQVSNTVTIVSGLPRSGTSMMMKVLEAGGLEPVVDHIRKADEDNPKGYYEFEPVKKTKEDPSWLTSAVGKVVKMVYRLLYDLPPEYHYRVVFMIRDIHEVLASQKKMLHRSGKNSDTITDQQMAALFTAEIEKCRNWLQQQPNFSVLYISYSEMVQNPQNIVTRINDFIGGSLNLSAMSSSVDPALYRNRLANNKQ